jgi:hypothetical protein
MTDDDYAKWVGQLLPCPFCGSTDVMQGRLRVQCNNCTALGPIYDEGSGKNAHWNRRSSPNGRDDRETDFGIKP